MLFICSAEQASACTLQYLSVSESVPEVVRSSSVVPSCSWNVQANIGSHDTGVQDDLRGDPPPIMELLYVWAQGHIFRTGILALHLL